MAKSQPQQKIRTNFGLKSKIYGHLKQVINTPTVLKKPNSLNQLSYVKGKVDARNMIVMRNKNKIPDARNKINLKRLGYSSESQKVNLINIPFGLKPRLQRKSELRNVSCHPTSLQVCVTHGNDRCNPLTPTLTKTLFNPLAKGHALVKDTGSSLIVTRSVPDVAFDGQNLTVTRRLTTKDCVITASCGQLGDTAGPLISGEVRNENHTFCHRKEMQNNCMRLPASQPCNIIKLRTTSFSDEQGVPSSSNNGVRSFSPIEAPTGTQKRITTPPISAISTAVKAAMRAHHERSVARSSSAAAKTQFTASKESSALPYRPRLFAARQTAAVSMTPANRKTASALLRSTLQRENSSVLHNETDTLKELEKKHPPSSPADSHSAPPAAVGQDSEVNNTKTMKKRRFDFRTLSEWFGSIGAGQSIPVVANHSAAKRIPESDLKSLMENDKRIASDYVGAAVQAVSFDADQALISLRQGYRLLVSNLHQSVTQDDITDLFGAIGQLKRANLLARGKAEVSFIHKEDASLALKNYHNRELDGQPMFVKLLTPLDAKVIQVPDTNADSSIQSSMPASLRTKPRAEGVSDLAPVDIPVIHKVLFNTGADTASTSKSVRFTVKL